MGLYFFVMEGWIKLYRKFSEWEWFNISEMVHLYIYLLLNANHEEGKWRGATIKRGQIITGLHSLNKSTGISIRTLRTCLSRLKLTKEIDIETTNRFSVITICNYENYQCYNNTSDNQTDKQTTSYRQTNDKQTTTNNNKENKKNVKNEKNIIPPTLEMVISYCKERDNKVDAETFMNNNTAKGWMIGKAKMIDWQAAVRTWEKNSFNEVGKKSGMQLSEEDLKTIEKYKVDYTKKFK